MTTCRLVRISRQGSAVPILEYISTSILHQAERLLEGMLVATSLFMTFMQHFVTFEAVSLLEKEVPVLVSEGLQSCLAEHRRGSLHRELQWSTIS